MADWGKPIFFIVVIFALYKLDEYILIPALIQLPFGFALVVFAVAVEGFGVFKLFESLFSD
jgi:hypothetical protein